MVGGEDLVAGLQVERLGDDVEAERGIGEADDIVGCGAQFLGQRDARDAHGFGQVAAKEFHRLTLELELPFLVLGEDRAGAGAERAVVEEDDILAEEELPGEIFGHFNGLSGSDREHRATHRRTTSSPRR